VAEFSRRFKKIDYLKTAEPLINHFTVKDMTPKHVGGSNDLTGELALADHMAKMGKVQNRVG
jgi:hypothetical protein